MLTGLGIPHGTDPDVLLRTYALSVHGIREDCVREVCGKYIRGDVTGHKKGRAPTTDLFTTECRSEAGVRTAHENRKAKRIANPEAAAAEHTQEHRAKMLGLLRTLRRALAGDREAQQALEPWGWKQ